MANLAQLDLGAKGREVRLRALLEDLIDYHKGVYPNGPLALAVWFGKAPNQDEYNLLELFSNIPVNRIAGPTRVSLHWKAGLNEAPFVNIYASSVELFTEQLNANPAGTAQFLNSYEVLYFDKQRLTGEVLRSFNVVTEPGGLMKGWYLNPDEYSRAKSVRDLMVVYGQARPAIGLVKIEESSDFESCRGLLHVEVNQKWLPISPQGLSVYSFYNDFQDGRLGYFLFQGGSLYRIVKFEVKTGPDYSNRLLEKTRDDRDPEVYLRAVHPTDSGAH
jgi:hypothetical protein